MAWPLLIFPCSFQNCHQCFHRIMLNVSLDKFEKQESSVNSGKGTIRLFVSSIRTSILSVFMYQNNNIQFTASFTNFKQLLSFLSFFFLIDFIALLCVSVDYVNMFVKTGSVACVIRIFIFNNGYCMNYLRILFDISPYPGSQIIMKELGGVDF